ncbi:MAG: ABC transporter permease [Kofleriaceae bacterium]
MLNIGYSIVNETRKGIRLAWGYRLNAATELVVFGLVFVGFSFFMGEGKLSPAAMSSALLGYLLWFYSNQVLAEMSHYLMEEAQAGTLEQAYMSPAPSWVLVFGRALASFVASTTKAVIMGGGLILILGLDVPLRVQGLVPFTLALVGVMGLAFIMAGLTIVFKRTTALTELASMLLLFFNGAMLAIEKMPGWLAAFAKVLPTTLGIVQIRRVVIHEESLGALMADGSLGWLVLHSAVWLGAGIAIFMSLERTARVRGTLGQY